MLLFTTLKKQHCAQIIGKRYLKELKKRIGILNSNYKGGGTEFICKECSISFKVPNHAIRGKKHGGHFCTVTCKNKFIGKVRMSDKQMRIIKNTRRKLISYLKRERQEDKYLSEFCTTVFDLKNHMESLFKEGMTWENHGEWHIDHIIPVSAFTYEDKADDQFIRCWHYKNLQPLWKLENMQKKGENRRILFEKGLLTLIE